MWQRFGQRKQPPVKFMTCNAKYYVLVAGLGESFLVALPSSHKAEHRVCILPHDALWLLGVVIFTGTTDCAAL